ncbi:MAG: ABC-F family ATP-binding cassette domain-containing protein, partial [Clostridiales bacterium]|nr:ABC-F family ATP-binding cassette domain-containing protein [Clostridiales bacterium]
VIRNLDLYLKKDLRTLLADFSFSLNENQKVALIGEEGNGKSTLLKVIYDESLVSDYIEIKGEITKKGEIIAYLPQQIDDQSRSLTTAEYFEKHVPPFTFDYGEFYNLLDQMELNEDRISNDVLLSQLSGGEKIKFQLLCIMMQNPTILLLDEPTNDLDIKSVEWLEQFINRLTIPIMFVSHDETLLENCANTIIHFEQLIRKSRPQYTIAKMGYQDYVDQRSRKISHQDQVARKEMEEYNKKMEKYRHIYQRVEHEQNAISRQDPAGARLLKKKMHSVKSMGKRFEREKENMTERPSYEESINVSFHEVSNIPRTKQVLNLQLDELKAGNKLLSKNIKLEVVGPKKICIIGGNGCGKTTLLRLIYKHVLTSNLNPAYMPQDYVEMMDPEVSPIDFISETGDKDEITTIRTYLGSMNFTKEEMFRPTKELSGGQKAKLYFSKMILNQANVLVLDEPTRNLSPLSGPEIRQSLKDFGGCIIAVSHDRKFIKEVCDEVYLLDDKGVRLHEQKMNK